MAIALKENENKVAESAVTGGIVAVVDVEVSGGLTPNTVRHAGRGSLVVASVKEMDPRSVHVALKIGGHSTVSGRGQFIKIVPPNSKLEPTLTEYPDGTSIQISELDERKPLVDASRSALVQASSPADLVNINSGVIEPGKQVKYIMHVYTSSENLEGFGVKITPDPNLTILSENPEDRIN